MAKLSEDEATPQTLYYTGSTTKSFTAAALSLLINDTANSSNALSWQTRITDVIRDHFVLEDEYITNHATLEDLASHRTGMPRHDLSYGEPNSTLKDVVRSLRYLPLTAGFRSTFQYCNMMFMTLSYVLESITGAWLGDFMRERIWLPLGMTQTFFTPSDATAHGEGRLATGYQWDNETQSYVSVPWEDSRIESGAGSIISTVLDYAKYLNAMIDEAPNLPKEWYTEMKTPRSVVAPADDKHNLTGPQLYTLGWFILNYRGNDIYYHSGAVTGFGAIMAFIPSRRWGFAAMGNTEDAFNPFATALLVHLVDDLEHIPDHDRFDWISLEDEQEEDEQRKLRNARSLLYPSLPSKPLPLTLPLESYCASYHHPGYGNITISISPPSTRVPMLGDPDYVLHVYRTSETDPYESYLEHVSGEHFVAWLVDGLAPKGPVRDAVRLEFVIAANGTPLEVGIELEPDMAGEKIWFKKQI